MDLKGALVHADSYEKERLYVHLPKITVVPSANGQVVYVVKYMYGFREDPKLWFQNLATTICKEGFRRSHSVDCLFIKGGPDPVYMVPYGDELLIVVTETAVTNAQRELVEHLVVTYLGICTRFLGMEVAFG